MMRRLNFDNQWTRLLPQDPNPSPLPHQVSNALWSAVNPTPVSAPNMIAYSQEVAEMLGITSDEMASPEMLAALSGNRLLEGMRSYATRYGGHQFGHWAGQLGDGRAIYLGELIHGSKRFELQLKGSGMTPYSRHADGRAVLRSSLREFLCSEAMHHLGIPTTRALSLVVTGDQVIRDMFYDGQAKAEPGAIVCRVSPSFTRPGHFELLAKRDERDLLKKFIGFTITRDFADWLSETGMTFNLSTANIPLIDAWFSEVCKRTARLIAAWMNVGFVHGVMNTDNLSIIGVTIDYGPYGWVDNFDPGWTPNTTDAQGRRYCFGRQPDIGRWNMERLAEALLPIVGDTKGLADALIDYDNVYIDTLTAGLANKFGLDAWQNDDGEWVNEIFELMTRAEIDMTLFFRHLGDLDITQPCLSALHPSFYTSHGLQHYGEAVENWLGKYARRIRQNSITPAQRHQRMNAANPRYVLRNYLAQEAIELAEQGNYQRLHTLLQLLKSPYTEQPGMERFSQKRPEWARNKAGCSMLSCSS